ncbi:MAG: sigma-70 family RNA polymerase sigma factor [Leptolyngbyaceae cyanobacterium CSU_1_4]|nr:sigma-70 family RNA polymerase sigma factor [Leptolyngbyaceae cyanobacterium CSU_1_4]
MVTFSSELKDTNLQLFKDYQQSRSIEIRNQLVMLNLGCVRQEAYRWAGRSTESYEDLVQVGSLGLIRAIERFDLSQGYALTTFAVPYIQGDIRHHLRDRHSLVKIPRRWQTLQFQSNQMVQQFQIQQHRLPTDTEISTALQISLSEWRSVKLAKQNRQPLSLDRPMEEGEGSLQDSLPNSLENQWVQEERLCLHHVLSQIETQTRNVLEFVFVQDLTQRETAEKLGISIITVSRRLKKGLSLLRRLMEERVL